VHVFLVIFWKLLRLVIFWKFFPGLPHRALHKHVMCHANWHCNAAAPLPLALQHCRATPAGTAHLPV
jgi:hypothetical protein